MAAQKKKKASERYSEIRNHKIGRDYTIEDRFEVGVVLTGTEVKSLRAGKGQIADAFARIERGQVWLYNAHIDEYAFGNFENHQPKRPRKLLLHKREILRLRQQVEATSMTLIPKRLYFKGGLVKVELCLCIGKKLYDKRQDLKKQAESREVDRAMKTRLR